MLNSSIQRIKSALAAYPWIEKVEFHRFDLLRTDAEKILLYRVRIHLQGGGLLDACERVTEKKDNPLEQTKYHFHWQDAQGRLVKRWDNAPHHPELDNFPHHVHHGLENDCRPGSSLSLPDVLLELDLFFRAGERHER